MLSPNNIWSAHIFRLSPQCFDCLAFVNNMSYEKNLTACPKHPECMINALALEALKQHRNTMLAKQPYFPFISFQRFVTLPKLRRLNQILRITFKSVPNLWHECQICGTAAIQICGMAAKFVAWRPNLWHGGQICGMAAKSVARRPSLWYGNQICGTATKSVARGQIYGMAAKSESKIVNLCTKEQKFEYISPFLS